VKKILKQDGRQIFERRRHNKRYKEQREDVMHSLVEEQEQKQRAEAINGTEWTVKKATVNKPALLYRK
jgi:hypothetical protein